VGGVAPIWLRLQRAGNVLTASTSGDGASWTVVNSVTVSMASDVVIGLAVTSHLDGAISTAVFEDVSVAGNTGPAVALRTESEEAAYAGEEGGTPPCGATGAELLAVLGLLALRRRVKNQATLDS
jgi:hypothetical protein